MNTKHRLIFSLLLLLLPFCGSWADNHNDNTYETPLRLFHIARSANRNLVCYDANLQEGKMDMKSPLKVYWVNREEHPGATNGLNYIQRKLAYGYKVVSYDKNHSICTLSAYPKRQLTIMKEKGKYVCYVIINHQKAFLRSLFVQARPHNPLNVDYVELRGISVATHKLVTERVRR